MTAQRQTRAATNPLERLHDYGQAVWLDFLSRRFIAEGGLKNLIDNDGLTVEDFGLPDNLMMIHSLELHGARLVMPRQRAADIWHDLASFEACVALAADRATGKSD